MSTSETPEQQDQQQTELDEARRRRELVVSTIPVIRRVLQRHIGNRNYGDRSQASTIDPEDVLGETCLRILRRLMKYDDLYFEDEVRLTRLVCSEAIRALKDMLRRGKTLKAHPTSTTDEGERVSNRVVSPSENFLYTVTVKNLDPAKSMSVNELINRTRRALETLPDRDYEIVSRRLGEDTLEEIGEELGISKERVRQLEGKAHKKLKRALTDDGFGDGAV